MLRLNVWIALSLSTLPLAAQMDRAVLTGTVLDPSRSVVPGAKVTRYDAVATGIDYATSANSAGVYTLTGLPCGPIHCLRIRYRVRDTSGSALHARGGRNPNASIPTIQRRFGELQRYGGGRHARSQPDQRRGRRSDHRQPDQELPVNGRYWASLEALIPGAISAGTGTQDQIRLAAFRRRTTTFASTAWMLPASITNL